MTEEHTTGSLERLLDNLDDCNLNVINYQALQNAVDSDDYISLVVVDKLLTILSQQDGNDDVKYTAHSLNIIFSCLKKVKEGKCSSTPNFTHSAIQVLKLLQTTAYYNKVEALKVLCFETLLSYPEETFIDLAENHKEEVIKLVNLFCHCSMPIEIRLQPVVLIAKLLKILPPDKRPAFIKDKLNIWFGKVIPVVVTIMPKDSSVDNSNIILNAVEALELLTDELVQYNYTDNCEWQCIYMNIYTPKKYPEIMKSLLENSVGYWYRLWIIFVKLLKNQLTMHTSKSVSPVNSLLPVVEMAFKMDITNRCKAFLCWIALIDNFSQETTESLLDRRIKLLVIPLLSNNAKVEETALAKLTTWWHLICKFQHVIDNYLELVLIRFLHFCFGKPSGAAFIPGKISKETKVKCVETFINVVGHSQCNGCVCVTKLDRKLFNTKLFVSHWKDWLHSIRCAIKICIEYNSIFSERHIVCAWKSFIMTIGELPENNIRTDLFNEVICLLENMTQECDIRLTSTILYNLIPVLFDNEDHIRMLLKFKDEHNAPICKIIKILLNLQLDTFDNEKTMKSLKLVTNDIVEDSLTNTTSKNRIKWILNDLSCNGLPLWTAMAESICYLKYNKCKDTLTKIILWPLKHWDALVDKDLAQNVWLNLYRFSIPYVKIDEVNEDIIKSIQDNNNERSCDVFTINAAVAILQQKLLQDDVTKFEKEAEILFHVSGKINETQILLLLPSLSAIIVKSLNKLKKDPNTEVAKKVILIFNNVLKSCSLLLKEQNENEDLLKNIEKILKALESILKMKVYSTLKLLLTDQLKNCANFLTKHKSVVNSILSVYNDNEAPIEESCRNVIKAYEIVDTKTINESGKQQENDKKFNKPGDNLVKKKSKKETKIVNTTVENGEEFVVVQSNWKFNLKKMTDNQKEKLQRKREDIPALYQDLSQSQDEFQSKAWKIDSQDSSSMSSKSTNVPTNEDATTILENIPKSDFLPKMLQNIQHSRQNGNEKLKSNNDNTKLQNQNINAAKNMKSPRLSLKDRVFRNVRNLMEKSNVPNELAGDKANNTENILNTPIMCKIKPSTDITNSAPSQLFADRPSRVKRKPKKFDDAELISLKRRRCSVNSTESSNSDSQINDCVNIEGQIIDVKRGTASKKEKDTPKGIENDTIKDPRSKNKNVTKIDEVEDGPKSTENKKVTDEKTASGVVIVNNVENASDNNTKEIVQGNSPSLINKVKDDIADILCPEDIKSKIEENSFSNNTSNNSETMSDGIKILDKVEENRIETITINSSVTPKGKKLRERRKDKSGSDVDNLKSNVPKIKEKESCFDIGDTPMVNITETNEIIEDKICNNQLEKDCTENNKKITEKIEEKQHKSKKDGAEKSCPNDTKNNSISTSNINKTIDKIESNGNVLSTPKLNDSTQTVTISTPKTNSEKSTTKNPNLKMSRIKNQLAIDMVEGHPFLKVQSEKRLTRKAVSKFPNKRKCIGARDKDSNIKNIPKSEKKLRSIENDQSMLVTETQDTEDSLASQDVIESSQDSTVTTISVKSNKIADKRVPIVMLESLENSNVMHSQSLLDKSDDNDLTNIDSERDLDLSPNKTIVTDLTENMDTQPVDVSLNNVLSGETNKSTVRSEDATLCQDTQNTAEADTQPLNPNMFSDVSECKSSSVEPAITLKTNALNDSIIEIIDDDKVIEKSVATTEDITMTEAITIDSEKDDASSPCIDEHRRKEDFLNNTIEISPIKTMSPLRENKTPSPETSTDYVVIKLASPVQINGEPYEKPESPEVFTEDKVSPDKRDRSPPRSEVNTTNTSPNSSLSLKKNRPQVRSGGRAAQMLGLCVPDKLQTIALTDKSSDAEESRKSPSLNTPARRNLRMLYNSTAVENDDHSEETEGNENFLSFKRTLPTTDCSPSGPILKRKLADIIDETTASPASKRKRVSFHDPPVSTTICVKKYIEPCGVRSPQNSAIKRQERQTRSYTPIKSPRRLENVFKLDSALTKTVESFTEMTDTLNTESSLDQTPILEVVKTSDLNDTDPICLELVDCKDPIANVAEDLSSRAMKTLLLKELEGKVDTISDLAKMTELEVNRLCIKAPKVQTVKKTLNEYLLKIQKVSEEITPTIEAAMIESILSERKTSVEIQTNDVSVENNEMQTDKIDINECSSQTDSVLTLQCSVQTEESGYKSTADNITHFLSERQDFIEKLCDILDESSKKKLADGLSFETLNDILLGKITAKNSTVALENLLGKHQKLALTSEDTKPVLPILQNYLIERFNCKELIMFCANLLQEVHRKS